MCEKLGDLSRALAALPYNDYREVTQGAKALMDASARFDFKVSDRVTFTGRRGVVLHGVVERRLKKNFHILVDGGQKWTVGPRLLQKEG